MCAFMADCPGWFQRQLFDCQNNQIGHSHNNADDKGETAGEAFEHGESFAVRFVARPTDRDGARRGKMTGAKNPKSQGGIRLSSASITKA
jgi:hypothetical protein